MAKLDDLMKGRCCSLSGKTSTETTRPLSVHSYDTRMASNPCVEAHWSLILVLRAERGVLAGRRGVLGRRLDRYLSAVDARYL